MKSCCTDVLVNGTDSELPEILRSARERPWLSGERSRPRPPCIRGCGLMANRIAMEAPMKARSARIQGEGDAQRWRFPLLREREEPCTQTQVQRQRCEDCKNADEHLEMISTRTS